MSVFDSLVDRQNAHKRCWSVSGDVIKLTLLYEEWFLRKVLTIYNEKWYEELLDNYMIPYELV